MTDAALERALFSTPGRADAVRIEADAEAALLRVELRQQGFFGEDLERIVVVAGAHVAQRLREETAALHASLSEQKRSERRAISDAVNKAKDAWFKVALSSLLGEGAWGWPWLRTHRHVRPMSV